MFLIFLLFFEIMCVLATNYVKNNHINILSGFIFSTLKCVWLKSNSHFV